MDFKLATLVIALCITIATADRGFLMTCPRSLEMNSSNIIQLRLYEVYAGCTLKIRLLKTGNDSVVHAQENVIIQKEEADAESVDINFFVPKLENEYNARIQINGTCDTKDNYEFYGEDEVYLRYVQKVLIFLQTDKPFYKPLQTVKLRALRLDARLRPILDDKQAEIYIEDPQGSRMAQWKGVNIKKMIQLQMPLSEEPIFGSWKIGCVIDDITETTYFDVKKYVLPTFEVKITPPSFVLADAEEIPVEICAKYTYGKGVEGDVKINVSLETYAWSTNKLPFVEYEGKLDGCMNYTINVSLIDTDTYYSYRRIQVFAMMTEKGTGISRNETKLIDRTLSPLKLEFEQAQRENFKPGLPYNGKLRVTLPDDSPAANEECELCVSVSRERTVFGWAATRKVKHCRNFTTDSLGYIAFTIPPQNTDSVNMYIEAKSIRFANPQRSSPKRPALQQPQTTTSLRPYHSPSGSFIQLKPEASAIPCGVKKEIGLLFTAKDVGEYQIFYEVVSKGKIVKSESVEVSFTMDNDVSNNYDDPDKLVNAVTKVIVPSEAELAGKTTDESEEECQSAREARYVPPIAEAKISVDVDAGLSSSFYLIVYYIRDDREVVADSQKYEVEKCFNNKVGMEFGDEEKQPGTKTSLKLTASPNSLCGIRVVDRSVLLMDSNEQLTTEKVYQALDRYDSGYHYSRNHCNDKVRQPGLAKYAASSYIIIPPRPWSSSQYEDSMTPFEVAGFIVISDLVLFTRPCKGSGHNVHESVAFSQEDGIRAEQNIAVHVEMDFDEEDNGAGSGAVALASVSSRRPSAPPPQNKRGPVTKSVVDIRQYFPEDWLFYLVEVGETGELITKETLPHTITEWVGSAVCVNEADGLGLSNKTTIRGFQAFFIEITLPYSVIRGEILPVAVSVFNYLDEALAINLNLAPNSDYEIVNGSMNGDFCIPGGKKETFTVHVRATKLGTVNFTVKAATAESTDVCGDLTVSSAVARDGILKNVTVEPEGFFQQKVESILFSPDDGDSEYTSTIGLQLPDDLVQGSERVIFSVTGDLMGPAIQNLDNLLILPSGCGEQNMAKFAPNIYALEYLIAVGKLTDEIKNKAINNLKTGAQRQMKYKHVDGSYSAFGPSDHEGSIYLTTFVVKSFAAANKHISIDYNDLAASMSWILTNQADNGCFKERGRTLDVGLQVGAEEASKNNTAPLTAYILSSLLTSGYTNESVISAALECIDRDEVFKPYTASLYAYAYALAISRLDKDNANYEEKYQKIIDGLFARANTTGGQVYFKNINGSNSIDVLTASYTVLAMSEAGQSAEKMLPIIRWLTTNRNSKGGFHSSQDTVVGIQAISAFAALFSNKTVDIKVETSGALEETVDINEENKLVVKKYIIKNLPSDLSIKATGKGTALMQVDFRYNTISPPSKKSFSITADFECQGDCSQGDLKICASYLPEGMKSSMGVVEAKLVSGMVANTEQLDQLVGNKKDQPRRYEINNNILNLYFDEFTNSNNCFKVELKRMIPIGDCKPAPVKVYDYYATANAATTEYTIESCSGKGSIESEQ